MSEDVSVTEIFEDVEADPDAIIAAYGADSVEDLVEGPGEHDPHPDPVLDGDVDAAADRLAELADVTLESVDVGDASHDERVEPATVTTDRADGATDGPRYTADSVGGGATVDVLPGDGDSLESFLGLDSPDAPSTDDDLVLVGPEPTATRVSNESFGPRAFQPATVDGTGVGPSTWGRPETRPDPARIDTDAATDRETELASSVFEWVS
ncbi:hypothetical protein [Halovivax cerinus]|uniref:Uncharacterized protein n=1 Tax=Halovivax cerinus TaxID=1487865 RepID=A0ABD5NSD7_9EURY|nr:hypothetical protein [Halovivax cerinus]